ncbi:MAG TPA: hypothetical protein VL494_23610 [Steroidobacteraceae bacterium]|jgi:uncharacterized membrane protein|nr:hypothetical protein [Steroidobacteraceae bacterium]
MRIASHGHAVFAATMIAVGLIGLISGDFSPIWQPVSKSLPAREVLAYVSAFISLACGIGLFLPRIAAAAARVLVVFVLLWLLVFKARFIVADPASAVSYETCAETAVMLAGAWVLYAWFGNDWDKQRLAFATGDKGLRVARVIYGVSMVVFGIAHFAYAKLTASLVPGWLPGSMAWAYFTGATYIAAGVAILIGKYARLAAVLSAWQIGLFTLLVWVPVVVAGNIDAGKWTEFVVSCALTAAAWVVADSYREASSPAPAASAAI